MTHECQSCGGQLQIKFKLNLRNFIIISLYLLALFFSFLILIRFSGWIGAIAVTAIAITLAWLIRNYFERYTQCKSCHKTIGLEANDQQK